MFSSNATTTKASKKLYLTLVLDHAIQGDRHIAFEIGGGICGSGFPDYDYYMQGQIPPVVINKVEFPCKSLMRRKMVESLAKKVKYLYIVNAGSEILLNILGELWLSEQTNVRYFSSLENFCVQAKKFPEELKDSAVIVDRVAEQTLIIEQDYAGAFQAMGIDIPVINAGAYKLFDEKVSFTTLFSGQSEVYLPKTWVVNKDNCVSILKEIDKFSGEQFVLKVPLMSHAKDTVIVDKKELKVLINAAVKKDANAIRQLKLPGTNRDCLNVFIDYVTTKTDTFIVREMVLPDPVKIGDASYRAAARSVFTVVYDTANKTLEHIELLDSYWQRPKSPYKAGNEVSHDNLITSDMQSVNIGAGNGSAVFTTIDQQDALLRQYNIDCRWTAADKQKHAPAVLEMAKTIVRGIAKEEMDETVLTLAHNPNPAVAGNMRQLVNAKSIQCTNADNFSRVMALSNDLTVFLSRQLMVVLLCYQRHNHCEAIPNHLLKACDDAINTDKIIFKEFVDHITKHVMKLSSDCRQRLISHIKSVTPDFGNNMEHLIKLSEKNVADAQALHHEVGLKAFKAKKYEVALKEWNALLSKLEYFLPDSEAVMTTHNNLAACYRDLGKHQEATQHFMKAIAIGKKTGRMDLAEKYNEKLYQMREKMSASQAKRPH